MTGLNFILCIHPIYFWASLAYNDFAKLQINQTDKLREYSLFRTVICVLEWAPRPNTNGVSQDTFVVLQVSGVHFYF